MLYRLSYTLGAQRLAEPSDYGAKGQSRCFFSQSLRAKLSRPDSVRRSRVAGMGVCDHTEAMSDIGEIIQGRIAGATRAIESLGQQSNAIEASIRAIVERLGDGGVVFTCGNGGSAAEALHLSEELVGKYRDVRPPLSGICLNADPTAITCIANDFGFDEIFARQLAGLASRGDLVVVFSTSGASENVLRALRIARDLGVVTVGLLGKDGGPALPLCDHAVVVCDEDTGHIQEAHQVILHAILESVDASLD